MVFLDARDTWTYDSSSTRHGYVDNSDQESKRDMSDPPHAHDRDATIHQQHVTLPVDDRRSFCFGFLERFSTHRPR